MTITNLPVHRFVGELISGHVPPASSMSCFSALWFCHRPASLWYTALFIGFLSFTINAYPRLIPDTFNISFKIEQNSQNTSFKIEQLSKNEFLKIEQRKPEEVEGVREYK